MIEVVDVSKTYKTGEFEQRALDGVSITFRDSEFVSILGPSGSGKTTLLNILGGLDRADAGDVIINGTSTKQYRASNWDTYRNHHVGFIFQSYNLIPHQNVLSNVELALTLSGIDRSQRRRRALEALKKVGLEDHINKKPNQLSGGQMQRVAIARALVNDPDIVLADEPTGALDSETGISVMELLVEISKDRLVIMVTHNPDLASKYSTRIVNLADGKIVGDSAPVESNEVTKGISRLAKSGKASMSFATALSLSFNNLMSKKGRTIMTALAGSIGIIGIAAILALANGVNEYIAQTEEETLASYPLTISKSSYDLTSLLTGYQSATSTESDSATLEDGSINYDGQIAANTMLTNMFSQIETNDLASFKEFLDSGESGIEQYVNLIQYEYDVTPQIFMADTTDGVIQLNPGALTSMTSSSITSSSIYGSFSMTSTNSFNEMIDNSELLSEQYEVLAGRWPENYDECVLVLSSSGKISDFTLYSLGVLDPQEFETMLQDMMNSQEVEIPSVDVDFTYGDALSLSFKVVNSCNMFQYNSSTGTWTDMSGDDDYMIDQINAGLDLKVVGVVKPYEGISSGVLTEGIAYPSSLTQYLMEEASNSEIVQQQIANPDVDVFSGSTFADLNAGTTESLDLSSMFSIDEDVMQSAFSFDTSLLSGATIDASSINSALDSDTLAQIMADMPMPNMSSLITGGEISAEQQEQIDQIAANIAYGFLTYWYDQHPSETITSSTDISEDFEAYMETSEVQAQINQIAMIEGVATATQVQEVIGSYMTDTFQPYFSNAILTIIDQFAQGISQALQEQMAAVSAQMGSAFSFDSEIFASAISFSMSEEDLSSIMTAIYSDGVSSYDNNLARMGYADIDSPSSISFYPIDFSSKDQVISIIDAYNNLMEASGQDEKVISYSDFVGLLMSSVTDIVNMISYVLIAFVSISLVVSSIMIGIITYISVLERKKEIGILRAMGASKGNIANVFNAETFIEGLLSGILAILVVWIVSLPVNAIVYDLYAVSNIMSLPITAALILVLISVVLTFIAGLIPSQAASRKDPVEALRSE